MQSVLSCLLLQQVSRWDWASESPTRHITDFFLHTPEKSWGWVRWKWEERNNFSPGPQVVGHSLNPVWRAGFYHQATGSLSMTKCLLGHQSPWRSVQCLHNIMHSCENMRCHSMHRNFYLFDTKDQRWKNLLNLNRCYMIHHSWEAAPFCFPWSFT